MFSVACVTSLESKDKGIPDENAFTLSQEAWVTELGMTISPSLRNFTQPYDLAFVFWCVMKALLLAQ